MQEWAIKQGFVLPCEEFFHQLRGEFSSYMRRVFSNFEFVSENEIFRGISDFVGQSDLPTISLDRAYFKSELNLEIARLVNEKGENQGLGHRAGSPPLLRQIEEIQTSGVREVTLVDDVIFTGTLLERVVELLSRINVRAPVICAGIGIAGGIKRIKNAECDVHCVRTYKEVIDEVCERDFYPGVPLSGRLLAGSTNIGVPYILPFGNPEEWASIPSELTGSFSAFCLHQTTCLFDEIERCSDREVLCQELGRRVIGLPMDETRYVDALRKIF